MLCISTFTHLAGIYRHRLVALWVVARVVDTLTSIVTIGSVAVARYRVRVRVLRLRIFLLRILEGIDGRLSVLLIGFQMSERHGGERLGYVLPFTLSGTQGLSFSASISRFFDLDGFSWLTFPGPL